MKKLIFSAVLLFCFCVFANGGPIFDNKLASTGNIVFVNKTDIRLVKENLDIKIDGERAHFKVKYIFQNIGSDTKIQFAFPMETEMFGVSDNSVKADREIKNFIEREKVLSYKISKNGRDLKWLKKTKTAKSKSDLYENPYKISEWFISDIEFKKFEKAEIYITYTIESYRELSFYSCSAMPRLTSRNLHYNFYPASFFGNGTVGDLSVTVDLTELKKDNGKLEGTGGLEFTEQTPGILKSEGKNVNFKKTKEFLVRYSIAEKDKSDYIKAKRLLPEQFRIVSPKILPEDVKKMFDSDSDTCFVIGKENEFTFLFDKKSLPGYASMLLKNLPNDKFKVSGKIDCGLFSSEISLDYTFDKIRKCDSCKNIDCMIEKVKKCDFIADCAYDLFDLGDYDATKVKECRMNIKIEPQGTTKDFPCISEILILPHYLGE